jgi:hypothetical protein
MESERYNKFKSFDSETQLDIYLYAMCCVEPSDLSILNYISRNGVDILPQITDRIGSEENPRDKMNLIRLVLAIDEGCSCVSNNVSIMSELRRAAPTPLDNDTEVIRLYKESYRRLLEDLESKTVPQM